MSEASGIFLSLGSNRGDRAGLLQQACKLIALRAGDIRACSPVYETAPWGFDDETPFLNQVIEMGSALSPEQLLATLLDIEKELGRVRNAGEGYSSRTMDIDILFFNGLVHSSGDLVIPHPSLYRRRFVLTPLADIAPSFIDPVSGKSILQLLDDCPDSSEVRIF